MIALTLRARPNALQVRAGVRFGHRDRTDQLAAGHAGQVTLLLLLGAVVEQVVNRDGMYRDTHAREAAVR